MRKLMVVVFGLMLAAAAFGQTAAERNAVLAVAHQFTDGFNKGDVKSALAACAAPVAIIDEFPPYNWQGQTACADWARDFDADSKKNNVTDSIVTLGRPMHDNITGDRAYLVIEAKYTFKQNGKKMVEPKSLLSVALQKGPDGWKITSWTWSKGTLVAGR